MTRQDLIEREAKRRCLAGGNSLDMQMRQLSCYADNDERTLWGAHYVAMVAGEIAALEAAGFTVLPAKEIPVEEGSYDFDV
jgi:hypothetical protein